MNRTLSPGAGSSVRLNRSRGRVPVLFLVTIAVLFGVFFRFHHLDRKVYWNDEVWTSLWLTGRTFEEFTAAMPTGSTTAGALNHILFTPGNPDPLSTVAAIAAEDPKQPALYMLLARIWADTFGRNPGTVRALSAVLSLLALIPLYGLCRELFPERGVAWTAIALVAVSPFHILYAQEARPYSLWILMLFVSSFLLLRSLRRNTRFLWISYGLSLLAGLFAHTLFALTIAGHGLYVLNRRGRVPPEIRRAWFGATALGSALFLPWAILIVTRIDRFHQNTGWVFHSGGYPFLFGRWGTSLASPFVDFGPKLAPAPGVGFMLYATAVVLILILVTWSFAALLREAGQGGFFVATLVLPTITLLMIPDLLLGGGRMSTLRFLVPLLVGLEIAVAWFVTTRALRAPLWNVALALLLAAGLASDYQSDRADTWWTKHLNADVPGAARVINEGNNPLVVGRSSGLDLRRVLSLCGALRPDVEVQLIDGDVEAAQIQVLIGPDGVSRDVFFYAGSAPNWDGEEPYSEVPRSPQQVRENLWALQRAAR